MSPSQFRRAGQLAAGAIGLVALTLAASCADSASAQAKAITDACAESTNMPRAICECLGERAKSDLNDNERAFVLATLREDDGETARLRGKLGLEGAMKAGMFMTNAATCARAEAEAEAEASP